jgi:glycyl-tRNA synthetase
LQAGPQDVTIAEGKTVQITKDMVVLEERDERTTGYDFVPSVIEPSFGVGRILYSVLEQSYWVRRDDTGKNEKRAVFSFTPAIAAQKVAVLPLMMKPAIEPKARALVDDFLAAGVACRTDDSGTAIGRKYARIDELGIPFCVTVDFEEDGCVTLRERDSAKQVRVPIADVVELVAKLSRQHAPMSWDEVAAKYPAQAAAAATA